ncbi:MAG TPA: FAD-dependent oxidoreductase [Puia sp.]|nr:FAD-dependent oxidoreductase [Puia sp.]
MAKVFDVIVLGLGANGSSALYHLSKTHQKVAGIDRYAPPHSFGSSHGQSRIIRQAYYENPVYVPFIRAAARCWQEIEEVSGEKLFLKTGGLMLGAEDAAVVRGARLSAEVHGIDYEYLDYADLRSRCPAFKAEAGTVGLLEKEAGVLFPEKCITAMLEQAQKNGAELYCNEAVIKIKAGHDAIHLTTPKGNYVTEKLIISAGAWVGELVAGMTGEAGSTAGGTGSTAGEAGAPAGFHLPLTVARQPIYWFTNRNKQQQAALLPDQMPVYIWEYRPGRMFYGFPDLGEGIKIGYHHTGRAIRPDELEQTVSREEIDDMKNIAAKYLNMEPVFHQASVCMYTNTPDEDFIIDYHPVYKNILIASPCSGHGFKFSSLTGKLLGELAMGQTPSLDLSPFSINRATLRKAGA